MKNAPNNRPVTPSQIKARSGMSVPSWNRYETAKSRSQSLPRNSGIDSTGMVDRNDSDRSYDQLERRIFQVAKQTSQEVDRISRETNNRAGRDRVPSGNHRAPSGGRHHRPRSLGAALSRNGHASGSDGNRYHSTNTSSGPDTDRRTDNETMERRKTQTRQRENPQRRNVEYVSVTNISKDGQMSQSLLKMDDSKHGETRIDELSSGKEIKRQLIRAMKELKDLGAVARVIDEIDDEEWLLMFVQELEVQVKQIILMERKIKQLIHQAREGRTDSYNDLIKGLTNQLKSKKSTLLDCLNDILTYFHDRLRSKDVRKFKSKYIHGVLKQISDSEDQSEYGTFGKINRKLKKITHNRPEIMAGQPNKWQLELQRVSRTVDEYLRMAMPSSASGSEIGPNDSVSSMGTVQRGFPPRPPTHARQPSGFSSDDFSRNTNDNSRNTNYSSQTLDRRRGRIQRNGGGWDPNRTRSLERGKKADMENSLRNADSGLDLDDSGSGNETFHSSDGGTLNRNENNNSHTSQRSGRPRERASIRLYVTTSSDDDGGIRQAQRTRDKPTEVERKTEESKRMKNHLEKLQREIQEARHSKHDKERQLGDAQQRVEKMQRAMAAGISEKSDLEAELIRLREQFRSGRNNTSRNVMVLQSRISDMDNRIGDDRRELEFSTEKIAQLQAELAGNRRTGERLERAKQDLEDQLNQLTVQLMSERKELRSLQLENVRLENELNEASQRLEDQADKSRRNESDLQREVNKLIDTLRDEKKRNTTLKRKGGTNNRELTDLQYQVKDQKSKLADLMSEHGALQVHNRKLQEMLKGEQQVNSSTMECIKKELEYTTQELSIQRGQASTGKAEFEKEIERLLFDNREIKEQSRKTQRELSKEITSLTEELKDERDRIHELQKENRKLRQENIELQTKLTKLENTRGRIRPENVTDTGTQVEDKSYTRKKAFDFYIDEVQSDAHKLLAKGREMEREVSYKAKEAEKRVITSPPTHNRITSPPPQRKASNNEPPSATSTFKRRFSFKKLTAMTKNKGN